MCRTHPLLSNCQDNAKLACQCTARYKMEWIYTQTKMGGGGSLELAQETRKKERLTNGYFLNLWFWHVQLFWWMILVSIDDNLLEILTLTLKIFTKLPVLRYLGVCNVLYIWECPCHPYLYNYTVMSGIDSQYLGNTESTVYWSWLSIHDKGTCTFSNCNNQYRENILRTWHPPPLNHQVI